MSHQEQKTAWEEGVAIELLQRAGDPTPPIDAFAVAEALGFEVQFVGGSHGSLNKLTKLISVPTRVRDTRQHSIVMHEVSHDALERAGLPDTEWAAWYVSSAAMLPRRTFIRDLQVTEWDLRELRAKHIHCSAELIARRICAVEDAVVAIWDNGKRKDRFASPWLPAALRGKKPSPFEAELAARVLETGEAQHAGDRLWGIPVFEGSYKRVITVCEAEQLGLRY